MTTPTTLTVPSVGRPIEPEEIALLATGAWVLGTGGGGSPYVSRLNLEQLYWQGRRCRLVAADALARPPAPGATSGTGPSRAP